MSYDSFSREENQTKTASSRTRSSAQNKTQSQPKTPSRRKTRNAVDDEPPFMEPISKMERHASAVPDTNPALQLNTSLCGAYFDGAKAVVANLLSQAVTPKPQQLQEQEGQEPLRHNLLDIKGGLVQGALFSFSLAIAYLLYRNKLGFHFSTWVHADILAVVALVTIVSYGLLLQMAGWNSVERWVVIAVMSAFVIVVAGTCHPFAVHMEDMPREYNMSISAANEHACLVRTVAHMKFDLDKQYASILSSCQTANDEAQTITRDILRNTFLVDERPYLKAQKAKDLPVYDEFLGVHDLDVEANTEKAITVQLTKNAHPPGQPDTLDLAYRQHAARIIAQDENKLQKGLQERAEKLVDTLWDAKTRTYNAVGLHDSKTIDKDHLVENHLIAIEAHLIIYQRTKEARIFNCANTPPKDPTAAAAFGLYQMGITEYDFLRHMLQHPDPEVHLKLEYAEHCFSKSWPQDEVKKFTESAEGKDLVAGPQFLTVQYELNGDVVLAITYAILVCIVMVVHRMLSAGYLDSWLGIKKQL